MSRLRKRVSPSPIAVELRQHGIGANTDGSFFAKRNTPAEVAIEGARAVAARHNTIVSFRYDYVLIYVGPESIVDHIVRDLKRAQLGYIPSVIGPKPEAELSTQEQEWDRRMADAPPARRRTVEDEICRERLTALMAVAPALAIADESI